MTNVDLVRLAGSRGRISDDADGRPGHRRGRSAAAWRPSASRWRSTSRAPPPRRSSTSRNERNATILDAQGRLAALSVGIPQFMLTSTLPVRFALEFLGVDEFREGDVFVANDPYHGGGHLPDYNVFAPVFADDARTGDAAHGADREHPVPPRRHRRRRARRLQRHRQRHLGRGRALAGREGHRPRRRARATCSTRCRPTTASPTTSATCARRSAPRSSARSGSARSSTATARPTVEESRRLHDRLRGRAASAKRSRSGPTASTRPTRTSTTTRSATPTCTCT